MRVFLDSSVVLSACGSKKSLSRLITLIANERGWHLVSSAYCRAEVARNVGKFGDEATADWTTLRTKLEWVPDALTSKRPLLLTASKDKPVLISTLTDRSKILLTLDLDDFGPLLGTEVYGTLVTTPRDFLQREGLQDLQT
ncbi:MAG: PIN domain-containing protein [Verrucomicrobia bacterium]|nr:PIN domain-containing protein [Verrucomicrobiota bacterium]MDA1202967.1 PIN domain-containing protein [Verrucomicrobiota bacterium]